MALTPLDIHNKQFSRSFRGYNETEVDEFLEQVGREFDQVLRDNAALREQVEALTAKLEQYRQLEDTLHNTLVVAQETAEEVKASAQKQAELLVNQARLEAEQIVQEARTRAEQLEHRYQELLNSMKVARARLRAMLLAHLQLLDETGGEIPGAEAEADAAQQDPGDAPRDALGEPGRGTHPDAPARGAAGSAATGSSPAAPSSSGPLGSAASAAAPPASWRAAREAAAARERASG